MADVRETLRGHLLDFINREGGFAEFAAKVGATPSNVRNWAAGANSPSLDRIAAIAAAYGLTPGALLETPGDREQTELLPDEADVVGLMRAMDAEGRSMLLRLAQALVDSGAYHVR